MCIIPTLHVPNPYIKQKYSRGKSTSSFSTLLYSTLLLCIPLHHRSTVLDWIPQAATISYYAYSYIDTYLTVFTYFLHTRISPPVPTPTVVRIVIYGKRNGKCVCVQIVDIEKFFNGVDGEFPFSLWWAVRQTDRQTDRQTESGRITAVIAGSSRQWSEWCGIVYLWLPPAVFCVGSMGSQEGYVEDQPLWMMPKNENI